MAQAAGSDRGTRSASSTRGSFGSGVAGFSWTQLLLCFIGALPLAIVYRQWLVPSLAGTDVVRWAKSLSVDDVAHGVGGFLLGWKPAQVDEWAQRQGHKMDSVLLFLARQSPWLLGGGMLVILIALAFCDDWCTPKRKQPGADDMPDDVRKEFEEIEKEMAELETELDEMEVEWRRDNPEEAAKFDEEEKKRAAAKGQEPKRPSTFRQPSRFYRKPRSQASAAASSASSQPKRAARPATVRRRRAAQETEHSQDGEASRTAPKPADKRAQPRAKAE